MTQAIHLTAPMRSVLDRMGRANHPALHTLTAQQAKAAYELGANVLEVPRVDLPRVEDFTVPARNGYAIPVRLYAPSSDQPLPLLVYFHGGGFVVGSIASHDVLCRELARLSASMVVSVLASSSQSALRACSAARSTSAQNRASAAPSA